MLIAIKMKKCVVELGHNDRLKKIMLTQKKFTLTLAFNSFSPEWLGLFG